MSSEDDIYILYESCEKGDEMPSKRGRKGRGRGVPPVRSPEYTPPGQESSQIGQGSGGRGRGKTGRTFSSFEEFQKVYGIRTAEELRDHPASMPSTSGYKEQQSGHKIAPEDIGLKFRDESHRSHAYRSEKSHDYEPSMSAAKEYRKPPVDIRFKSKEKVSDEPYRSYNYPAGKSRDCKPSSVHGTSARDYRKGHNVTSATFKNESHTHSSERSRDFESSTSDDRSPDYESSTTDEEYRKGHTAASRDIGFKIKQDELHRYTDPSERSRDYEPSISTKEYRKGHKAASEDSGLKIKRDDSYRPTIPAEISHDYEPCSVPSTSASKEYRKEHKVNPEDIGLKFKDKSSEASLFPKRPGLGKEGRPIKIISNLYPIEFPTGCAYHYDVEVFDTNQRKQDPGHKKYQCLNTKKNREVISYMLHNSPVFKRVCGAFDGKKNLLTREKLNIDLPFSCSVMLPSEKLDKQGNPQSDNFKVEIKSLVSRINLDSINAFYKRRSNVLPQDAIMAIEIILRHGPCLKFTPIGRCFFFPPDVGSLTPFGGGLEIWFGYHQSIRLSQWCPTVNLDVSATTFWEAGPVIDYIAEYMNMSVSNLRNLRCLNRNQVRGINRKLKQRQIKVTHLSYGRRYRILRLRDISANQECIEIKDKRDNVTRMTVAQYFKETYRKDLQFGNLPCVQVQPEKKNIFMPIEVCEFLQGQHYKGDLTQAQRTKMIQFTSNPPHERFRKIQDIVHNKANFSKDKTAKGFGIEVSNRPLIADARVLDSPSLMYKDKFDSEKEILPRNGQWDVRGTQFIQAAKISSWVLISFQRDRNLDAFAAVLKDIGRNLGLKIGDPSDIIIENAHCDKERLFGNLKKRKIELAVIVIPYLDEREEKLLYAEIKKAAETVIGLATQCIKAERLKDMSRKRWPQIASNLCLKINAKLGGENHSLFQRDIPSILCKPVIIIGADVNHPAPTQPNQPSIAACVGSLDCFGKRFAVSIRAQVNSNTQKKKVEQILELENMVHDLLLEFYRHTRRQKPEKIIFYRDGVSEGELVAVKNEEVLSIRKACRRLDKEYQPGITVIVVQKRHHVRFKPSSRDDGVGPKGNLPPGTVIDTEVTHPVNFDFFLCSQYGLQGTSRPSHYLVVEDDNKFTADDLQKLTFQMCHMYVRCTKSISIPAPVAYADLVAYRARKHLDCKRGDDSSSSDCSRSYRLTQEDIDAITVVDGLKDSMYFV